MTQLLILGVVSQANISEGSSNHDSFLVKIRNGAGNTKGEKMNEDNSMMVMMI